MGKFTAWLRTELPMISGFTQAALALIISLGFTITPGRAGAIEAAVAAAAGLLVAIGTRPFAIPALTGFSQALILLLVGFGVHGVQPGLVATVNGVIVALGALVAPLLVRQHVSPKGRILHPRT